MKTLAVPALIALLGQEPRATVNRVEHAEMEYGIHWRWNGHDPVYTAAGLRLLADAFDAERNKPAAMICRAEAAKLDASASVPLSTEMFDAQDREIRAKRWDLKEALA